MRPRALSPSAAAEGLLAGALASAGVQFCLSDARSMQRAFFCKSVHDIRALQVLFNRRVSKVELALVRH